MNLKPERFSPNQQESPINPTKADSSKITEGRLPNGENVTRVTAMTVGGLRIKATELYGPGEIATAFKVDPKTVTRWIKQGRFGGKGHGWIKTPGNHHRVKGLALLAFCTANDDGA